MGSSGIVVEGTMFNHEVKFAKRKVLNSVKCVMSVVKVRGKSRLVVSVITSKPVPKDRIWLIMKKLVTIEVETPLEIGQLIVSDVCSADMKATRRIERA